MSDIDMALLLKAISDAFVIVRKREDEERFANQAAMNLQKTREELMKQCDLFAALRDKRRPEIAILVEETRSVLRLVENCLAEQVIASAPRVRDGLASIRAKLETKAL